MADSEELRRGYLMQLGQIASSGFPARSITRKIHGQGEGLSQPLQKISICADKKVESG